MAKTIDELKVQANQIKNETAQGANTSQRIGQMHLDAIEYIENQDKKFNELNISNIYKTNGIDGSNRYTLEGAIAQVPSEYRTIVGLKITFINNATSKTETWKYNGGTFTTTTNWKQGDGSGGNLILEWNSDVATTRKQVLQQERKKGLVISYLHPELGWVAEKYVGSTIIDTEWSIDKNWQKQIDVININNQQIFITAKNLVSNINWVKGYKLDGNGRVVVDAEGVLALSEVLPILPNKIYTITQTASSTNRTLSFLDKNGQLIQPNNYGYNVAVKTFTTPSNCVAIQFAALISDIENNLIQLEYGSTSTGIDRKNYSIQEKLKTEYQEFVYDGENIINQLSEIKMSITTDGTNTLNTNGYALTPFKVTAGDVINSYGCSSVTYGATSPLFAFFSKEEDYTTVEDFILTAKFIADSTAINGKHIVPDGANYAVIFRLRNNPNVKFGSLDGPIILINKEYSGYKSKKYIPDVDLRHDFYDSVNRNKQSNKNYGLFYWDGIDDKGSELMSYTGWYLQDSNLKLAQYVKEASEELQRYNIVRSIQLEEDTIFNHGGSAKSRVIQTKLPDSYYIDAYLKEEVKNYYDLLCQYSILVKYDGDISDLSEFIIGRGGYTVPLDKVNSITILSKGVYLLASKTYNFRLGKDKINSTTKFGFDENVKGTYFGFEIPLGIKCEVGGIYFWVARSQREYDLFVNFNDAIFIPTPNDEIGINNRDVVYPIIKRLDNNLNKALYSGLNMSKIVWLGTSVPNEPPYGEGFTKKYPEFVASLLQASVTVRSIGGTKMTYNPEENVYGLSMTLEEYNSHQSEAGEERSYEQQLEGCWDSDLFVFDHLHNDNGLLAALKDNPEYWDNELHTFKITESNKFDRKWAVGAFNYVIAEIFRYNPRAKIAIINDWRAEPFYNKLANRVVADLWGIPICELRMCNGNVDITTTKDTYLRRYNGGANIKLLAGSSVNPLYYQTKSSPDESASVVEEETSITYEKGIDSIHPGRYGRIMYAKGVARWMINSVILDNDTLDFYY